MNDIERFFDSLSLFSRYKFVPFIFRNQVSFNEYWMGIVNIAKIK